jgi:hypothetical protein
MRKKTYIERDTLIAYLFVYKSLASEISLALRHRKDFR